MDLSAYLDRVTACTDVRGLKRLLTATFDELGAKAVSGYVFPYGGAGLEPGQRSPIITTFPDSVSALYQATLLGDDPVMYAAMTLGAPVHFLKIERSLRLSEAAQGVLAALHAAGFADLVATPVFAKPGAFGYFTAGFEREQPQLTTADLRRIKFLFSEFFFRYRELALRRRSGLSQREREVLVSIVQGKSNGEIATLLGVSEHTVETYVRRCFAKLDVSNRTQAALRFLGLAGAEARVG